MHQMSLLNRGLSVVLLAATALLPAGPSAAQVTLEVQIGSSCPSPYVVVPGDTLYGIARRCGTTVDAIVRANPQIEELGGLRPGLRVFFDRVEQPRPGRPVEEMRTETYRVRRGDTMASIAEAAGVSLRVLLNLNPDVDPRRLRTGDRILVPAGRIVVEERRDVEIRLGSTRGEVGSLVDIDASGFPPRTELEVLMGSNPSDLRVVDRVRTDRRGRAEVAVRIPNWAARERTLRFGFQTERGRLRVVSEPFRVIREERPRPADRISVTGRLTRGGVECQLMRGDDGEVYSLLGDLEGYRAGDRVRVVGRLVEMSYCQQGTTIEVRRIEDDR